MTLPIGTILSLASAFMKNDTGHPVKKATVGALKSPVTAPMALATAVVEKPIQSAGIATIGAIAGSYMQEETDMSVYSFALEAMDKVLELVQILIG